MSVPIVERDLSHPFDRGYWQKVDDGPRPADPDEQVGFDVAAAELAEEANEKWDDVLSQAPRP